MANPTLLDMPIARDGNKNAIPTTDNGTTGLLSQQYGWQLINAIPPQQGGKAVKREDFNGALYLLSNLLFYMQKGWQFEWDPSQAYYAGCIVKDPNNGKMYQRLNDGTSNTAPHSDTTNWKLWDLSMLANYLPLSGGTLTGAPTKIDIASNDSFLSLYGYNRTQGGKGASIVLFGDNAVRGGEVGLIAESTSAGKRPVVRLRPNGDLWLCPDEILQSSTYYDLGGSAIVAKSLGESGYVKRADGEILQWGTGDIVAGTMSLEITLPISYTHIFSVVASCRGSSASDDNNLNLIIDSSVGVDKFVAKIKQATNYGYAFEWITVGY